MLGKDRGGREARDDPRELNRDNTRPKGKAAMRGTSINIKVPAKGSRAVYTSAAGATAAPGEAGQQRCSP